MRKIEYLGIWFFFLIGAFSAFGQQIQVKASLDSTYLLIGAQTKLKLEATKPNDAELSFPLILDTITHAIEVLESSSIDTSLLENDLISLKKELLITSFEGGLHEIPPFRFFTTTIDGTVDTLLTDPLQLEILLVPVDTSQAIKPIKGPESLPITLKEILLWTLGGFGLVLLAVGILLFYKRRKKPEEAVIIKRVYKEPAHIIALRNLDKLKNEKRWQSGKIKAFHSKLTDIVREYIEHRFQIPALEKTSHEVFGYFRNTGLADNVPFEQLQQMLYLADMVKFAKGQPKPDENERSLELAYEFVEKTKQLKKEETDNE
ncbi:MAG: cytochrome c-type biogenesis protein CcmH [Bacteroidetes bacterium]|nr:cytochrome c-type biogenesis protein CcmH [Bacteroidota bacterium]